MNVSVSADTVPLLVIVFFTGVALGALAALASKRPRRIAWWPWIQVFQLSPSGRVA